MATPNRGQRITKLLTQVKKNFKPVPPPPQRTLLEHLLYASLLENSPHDVADKVFQTLQDTYCGWNEVRVSTRRELTEVLKPLNDPVDAAERLKRTLHNVFESVYEFDLETLKKQNLGQSTKQLDGYVGTTPYMVSYVVQHALGGHSIPINKGLLIALEVLEVINSSEAAKHTVPGLERTVPKTKGPEVASLLHQLGVEVGKSPYGTATRKLLLALDPGCKDRLPKKPAPPQPAPKPSGKAKPAKPAAAKKPTPANKTAETATEVEPAKKKAAKKAPPKTAAKKKASPAKKKPAPKPVKKKAKTVKKKAKAAGKKLTKKKPK